MPSSGFHVPIVFLVFKRPSLTARVLERIRAVRPSQLFIVADGPRSDRPDEAELCRAVREVTAQGVDWPCEVHRDYADGNMGCARRVSSGITRVFESVEQAIVLEDDCVPEPSFFAYAAELLERYRSDERVGQIAGCSFRAAPARGNASYYFSRYPHCWGWATWRRAWQHYDHAMTTWRDARVRADVLGQFHDARERNYWDHALSGTASGRIDSWAYRWTLTCWARGWLSATASENLVSNIGFASDATHTNTVSAGAALPTVPIGFPLRHPTSVERDAEADAATGQRCFRRPPLWRRISRRFRLG